MPTRSLGALVVALSLLLAVRASADKVDDLSRSLIQDPSYKVRVQAALSLGKARDARAVHALMQALHDENETVRGVAATSLGRVGDKTAANALMVSSTRDSSEFVRTQAKKALEALSSAVSVPPPRAGAKFYLAIGFTAGGKGGAEYTRVVREALAKELQKLPAVTLSVAGAGGAPSKSVLASHHLQAFVVDGTIERLAATGSGMQRQIDCDVKAYVGTWPEVAIRSMVTEGASLQVGSGPSEEMSGKRDCLNAVVEAIRDDVGNFLRKQE
jgi:hypothetical protein